jgi:hypothetical protein
MLRVPTNVLMADSNPTEGIVLSLAIQDEPQRDTRR